MVQLVEQSLQTLEIRVSNPVNYIKKTKIKKKEDGSSHCAILALK